MDNAVTYFYMAAFAVGAGTAWALLFVEALRTLARQEAPYVTGRLPLGTIASPRLSARTRAR